MVSHLLGALKGSLCDTKVIIKCPRLIGLMKIDSLRI